MRLFRIHERGDETDESETNISVLVRISDAHSEGHLSFDLLVDPWEFFASNELALETSWKLEGTMPECDGAGPRKKPKRSTLHATWGTSLSTTRSSRRCKVKETYTYKPLNPKSIRMLRLLPGEKTQDLRGIITHVSANLSEDGGGYCALSYVWGTDDPTDEVITPDGSVEITPSLGKALRHLRQRTAVVVLWIDAICINQKDNVEKSHQIQLLPRIFQGALFTYAFWDGAQGEFDAVVEMLMQVQAKARMEKEGLENKRPGGSEDAELYSDGSLENGDMWPDGLAPIPESWKDRCVPQADDAIWDSVGALFSLPWFRRAWIVQETVASSTVRAVCGNRLVNFSDVHSAMDIIDHEAQVSDDSKLRRCRASWQPFLTLATQREWEMSQHRWALLFLLEQFRHAESTLSRDRFFALLGLASDANEPEFAPDYDSPMEAIVLRFATVFVRQGRAMQMLSNAGLNAHSHRFPSWIPDWTKTRPECLHESDQRANPFGASGPHEARTSMGAPNADELVVGGYAVDRVQHVSASTNTEGQWKQYLAEVDTMIDKTSLAPMPNPREDLKWKVPIAGVEYSKFSAGGALELKLSYLALRKCLGDDGGGKNYGELSDKPPFSMYAAKNQRSASLGSYQEGEGYASTLRDVAVGWRFITTERGYVGVAPALTQIGDTVAILKGGPVPFMLRESLEKPGGFRLVGEGYVHGMMHGEGLLLEGVEERDFRIS